MSLQYSNINNQKKVFYVFGDIYDYIQERITELLGPNQWLYKFVVAVNSLVIVAKFINMSLFLRTGKYPTLKERILRLEHEYVGNNMQRYYTSKYMTRELLWNGLIVSRCLSFDFN